jgi:hypothetical protein
MAVSWLTRDLERQAQRHASEVRRDRAVQATARQDLVAQARHVMSHPTTLAACFLVGAWAARLVQQGRRKRIDADAASEGSRGSRTKQQAGAVNLRTLIATGLWLNRLLHSRRTDEPSPAAAEAEPDAAVPEAHVAPEAQPIAARTAAGTPQHQHRADRDAVAAGRRSNGDAAAS